MPIPFGTAIAQIRRRAVVATLVRFASLQARLAFNARVRQLKGALKVRTLALALLQSEMRLRNYPGLLPFEDDVIDDLLYVAACELCDVNQKGVNQAVIQSRREEIDKLKASIANSAEGRSARALSYEAQILIDKSVHVAEAQLVAHYDAIRALGHEVRDVSPDILRRSEKAARRRLAQVQREIRSTRSIKFEIPSEVWGPALSVGSAVFIVSGYLYNSYVLHAFGIDVSHYFGLTDYLAASIENIRYAVLAALFPLLGMIFGLVDRSRMSVREREKDLKSRNLMWLFFAPFIWGTTIIFFFLDRSMFYRFAELAIVLVAIEVAPHVGARFTKPLPATLATTVAIIYAGTLSLGALKRVADIESKIASFTPDLEMTFTLASDLKVRPADLVLISANSSYFFFINKNTKQSIVLPSDQVRMVVGKALDER